MIIVSRTLLDILTLRNRKVAGMALWPVIIFADEASKNNPVMMNHEKIHHRQQLELLILPYYIWYFMEYWTAMFSNGFRHHAAYMAISFEKEAFAMEKDPGYLQKRKWLASWPFFLAKFKKIK
jgi:hypothetical protein